MAERDEIFEFDAATEPGSPLALVRDFVRAQVCRDRDAVRAMLDPEVVCIGTGADEWVLGAEPLAAALVGTIDQMPPDARSRFHSIEVREDGATAIVCARLAVSFRAGGQVVTLDELRWSGALARREGRWRFRFLHLSAPMRAQAPGKAFPEIEELLEEQRTLERRIAERTRELAEERARVEAMLERELAHQVAERSRELASALGAMRDVVRTPIAGSRVVDRYRVIRSLGEGAMGAVVEVERTTDARRLALKVMTTQLSPESAARFAREAEIGARLRHPNLVAIVDVGVAEGGAPYLAMELVAGGSLEAHRARFGHVEWALPVLAGIARGIEALHAAGVVHRDLKPANVLLDELGRAKVGDFGIARLGGRGATVDAVAATIASGSGPRTRTGAWIGTPAYMPPESARGAQAVDAPGDLFALGVLAHELLTGHAPFATPAALLALAAQPLPAPPAMGAAVPERVASAIRAALSEDPSARPSAATFAAALA